MTDKEIFFQNKETLILRLKHDLPVLRARLGISQSKLASQIGVSRQTYNSIESGRKNMSWTIFMALIAVFQSNEETRRMLDAIEGLEDITGLREHCNQY